MKSMTEKRRPPMILKRMNLLWVVVLLGLLAVAFLVQRQDQHSAYQSRMARTAANARMLMKDLKFYAGSHEGRYPNELKELVTPTPAEDLSEDVFDFLMKSPWASRDAPGPLDWIYISGLSVSSPPDHPVLISPLLKDGRWAITRTIKSWLGYPPLLPPSPKRIVATADGQATEMDEDDFQELSRKYHLTLRAQQPPMR